MNRKQLLLLLVIAVGLGFAGWQLYHRDQTSWTGGGATMGSRLMKDFPVNDIASFTLTQGTNQLVLARTQDVWRVQQRQGYPANFAEISGFLVKLPDLKAVQVEEVGPSQLWRFGLLAPGAGSNTATQVEFRDVAGKPLGALLLGKMHTRKSGRPSPMGGEDAEMPDGRYVQPSGVRTVALVSETFQNVEASPERWLNKDFFRIEKPRSISVAFPAAAHSWSISRTNETGEWLLGNPKPGEQLDVSKVGAVSNPFSYPTFNDVLPASATATSGLDQPVTITVETFDGFTYRLKTGAKTNESLPLVVEVSAALPKERVAGKDEKPEDTLRLNREFNDRQKTLREKLEKEKNLAQWIYLVPAFNADALLKPRPELLVEAKPAEPATPSTPPPGIALPPGQ